MRERCVKLFLLIFLLVSVGCDKLLFEVYTDYFFPIDYCIEIGPKDHIKYEIQNEGQLSEFRCLDEECFYCGNKPHRIIEITLTPTPNIFDHVVGDRHKHFSLRFEKSRSDQPPKIPIGRIARLKFKAKGDCNNYRTTNLLYVQYDDIPENICFHYGQYFYKCECRGLTPSCKQFNDIKCTGTGLQYDAFGECNLFNEKFVCGPKEFPGKRGVVGRLFRQIYLDDSYDSSFLNYNTRPYCIRSSIIKEEISIDRCYGKTCRGEEDCEHIVANLPFSFEKVNYFPGKWPQRGWMYPKGRKPSSLNINDIGFVQKQIDEVVGVEYIMQYYPLFSENHCEVGERCECYNNELHCAFFLNENCTGNLDESRGFYGSIDFQNSNVAGLYHYCGPFIFVEHIQTINYVLYGFFSSLTGIFIVLLVLVLFCHFCCNVRKTSMLGKYHPRSLLGSSKVLNDGVVDNFLRTEEERRVRDGKFSRNDSRYVVLSQSTKVRGRSRKKSDRKKRRNGSDKKKSRSRKSARNSPIAKEEVEKDLLKKIRELEEYEKDGGSSSKTTTTESSESAIEENTQISETTISSISEEEGEEELELESSSDSDSDSDLDLDDMKEMNDHEYNSSSQKSWNLGSSNSTSSSKYSKN